MLNCLPLGGKKRCRHLLRVQAPSETRCSHPRSGYRGGGRLGLDGPHPRDRQGRRSRLDTRHSHTAEGYRWARQRCLQGTNPSCQTCDLLYLGLVLVRQLLHRLLTPCRCLPSPAQSWSLHHCKKNTWCRLHCNASQPGCRSLTWLPDAYQQYQQTARTLFFLLMQARCDH